MALTDAQSVYLYMILEVPRGGSVTILTDQDNLVGIDRTVSDDNVRSAHIAITNRLTDIAGTAEETLLATLLDRYAAIGTDMTVIEVGSLGNMGGVTDSPDHERAEVSRQVKVIVPLYRCHEEIEKQKRVNGSSVIPIIR